MDALGADISTIGTNPAGIGLFRKSQVTGSFGLVSQQDVENFSPGHKTTVSFDQIGFVFAKRSGRNSYVNFAFNYHKSKNFNQILAASDRLDGASQNKLSYIKLRSGLLYELDNEGFPDEGKTCITNNQLDYLYYNNYFFCGQALLQIFFVSILYFFGRCSGLADGCKNFYFSSGFQGNVSCMLLQNFL